MDRDNNDKHDGGDGNYHGSILRVTNAAPYEDCHDNCHRSILCITSAASYEMMMTMLMLRMKTVRITIIVAPSALPTLPNTTFEMHIIRNKKEMMITTMMMIRVTMIMMMMMMTTRMMIRMLTVMKPSSQHPVRCQCCPRRDDDDREDHGDKDADCHDN